MYKYYLVGKLGTVSNKIYILNIFAQFFKQNLLMYLNDYGYVFS